MNAEERFNAALQEFAKAYRDYVMSSENLSISKTSSNGYVGNISFNINGFKCGLSVGDDDFVCVHDIGITYFMACRFSKSDCKKLKKLVVGTLGEVDKQQRIKELEKELKKLKGQ
jgi:hypothetical protein